MYDVTDFDSQYLNISMHEAQNKYESYTNNTYTKILTRRLCVCSACCSALFAYMFFFLLFTTTNA